MSLWKMQQFVFQVQACDTFIIVNDGKIVSFFFPT